MTLVSTLGPAEAKWSDLWGIDWECPMNALPQKRPILSVTVRPKSSDDGTKLQQALGALLKEDSGIATSIHFVESEAIIKGMGELHLEGICERLVREFGIPVHVGKPTVIYLETIQRSASAEGKYMRQVGGKGQYAHVELMVEPGSAESGYQFLNQSPESAIPGQFLGAIDSGIRDALKAGILSGNEIVDTRVSLRNGSYHAEDSNELSFQIAASMALKEAARKANPILLEPWMSVQVTTDEVFVGTIVGDLALRDGQIEHMRHSGERIVIDAMAPLERLLGFSSNLRSLTQGRGTASIQFFRYQAVRGRGRGGPDEIGVPAIKPRGPTARKGGASADPKE
jgi:elongation factor G